MGRAQYVIAELKPDQPGGFCPRGAARQLWMSKDHEVILAGAAETGKTFACCQKLNALAWKYPGMQAAIVRKTYASMVGSVVATFKRVLGPNTPVRAFGGERPEWFDYPNGSRVYIGGLDNPQKVLSSERDVIYVNQAEELDPADWEVLLTRCTGRGAHMPYTQLLADCNPGPPTHWILQRPSLRVLESRHEDNPTLFDEAGQITDQGKRTLEILDSLTGVRKARLRYGRWVQAEGAVYEAWDRRTHIVEQSTLIQWGILSPDGRVNRAKVKDVYCSVDWGFTNPGCIQVWAVDKDDRIYLLREIYRTGQLIGWWVEQARSLIGDYAPAAWFCDPSEPAYIKQFRSAGLNAIPAVNEVAPGIQSMQERLLVQLDGYARLYVLNTALVERDQALDEKKKPCGLVEEIEGYVWAKGQDGKPQKEEPVKENDHACDTARYMCHTYQKRSVKPRHYSIRPYR